MIQNKYHILLALFLVLASMLLVVDQSLAKPDDPFIGAWWTIEPDGSNAKMSISGNGNPYHVFLFDDNATGIEACPSQGPFIARGIGTADGTGHGSILHTMGTGRCLRDNVVLPDLENDLVYDAFEDTLIFEFNEFTIVWHRNSARVQ